MLVRLGLLGLLSTLLGLTVSPDFLHALLFPAFPLFLDETLALTFLFGTDDVAHGSSGAEEVGVVCVDVRSLDRNERLNIC